MSARPERSEAPAQDGWAELDRATQQLRRRPEPRAVQVANDVLRRALQSGRRSLPIRARPPHDFVRVSDQVLIRRLRTEVDGLADDCAVGRIALLVDPDASLREVTIELFVRYGVVIPDSADSVRGAAQAVIDELLGEPEDEALPVDVVLTHVHVADVTVGSPHLTEPGEEL